MRIVILIAALAAALVLVISPIPAPADSFFDAVERLNTIPRGQLGQQPRDPRSSQRYLKERLERERREANPRTREEECRLRYRTYEAIERCTRGGR
jgi:uncharacterized membrane protein